MWIILKASMISLLTNLNYLYCIFETKDPNDKIVLYQVPFPYWEFTITKVAHKTYIWQL
jgi:hypothetical protein